MTAPTLTAAQANAIYGVLVEHADAAETMRDEFVFHLTRGCEEFRFMGSLGFGGKLYVEPRRWRVGAYAESVSGRPERQAAIDATNQALTALHDAEAAR